MHGVPVKVDKYRTFRREQPAHPDKALAHHLQVLALLPHILEREAAVVFDSVEIALAAQERRIDVNEINFAFKAVLQ